jgi:hypothetical protein
VFVSDALKRLKIISAPKVAVGVAITGDIMNLSMTSDDISREQLLEILSKYNRKKKFYRLKNGDFVNVTGEELENLLELKQGLHLTDSQLKQITIEIPRFRALYMDAELRERASISVSRNIRDKVNKCDRFSFEALILDTLHTHIRKGGSH